MGEVISPVFTMNIFFLPPVRLMVKTFLLSSIMKTHHEKNDPPKNLYCRNIMQRNIMNQQSVSRRGFTLIMTISLMVLLTLIAFAMLSLSSVTLRTSNQANAMSVARSNARLALLLAINELQKSAGPDQRITARSDILGENLVRPRLTGIWKSRNPIASPPTVADYSAASKKGQFVGWLVSSSNPRDAINQDFAYSPVSDSIRLWGEGTLGMNAPAMDLIDAGKMQVTNSIDRRSALAWAVCDEGIKARINTPYDFQSFI